jgi:chloramphenicol 3-O phosphotransferase
MVERPELKPHFEKVKHIFSEYPLYIARGNRTEDQSDLQNKIMAKDIPYNYSVNTHLKSPEECADLILKHLYSK